MYMRRAWRILVGKPEGRRKFGKISVEGLIIFKRNFQDMTGGCGLY